MREILFRGKSTDTGEWVEGAYYKQTEWYGDPCEDHYIITTKDELEDNMMIYFEILPETLCEYTNLRDKNGRRIFEGDIVKYKSNVTYLGKFLICIGKVEYNENTASYAVDAKDNIGAKNYDYFPIKCEIVGNIHDNPEMLEGV
jgi:uncharacterized phage protein (TIGR01671 family)